jgi:hypothetical protein
LGQRYQAGQGYPLDLGPQGRWSQGYPGGYIMRKRDIITIIGQSIMVAAIFFLIIVGMGLLQV